MATKYLNNRDSSKLTSREVELFALLARGKTDKEISSGLGIAITTVGNHLRHIYAKLKVNNRTEAVVRYSALRGTSEVGSFRKKPKRQ